MLDETHGETSPGVHQDHCDVQDKSLPGVQKSWDHHEAQGDALHEIQVYKLSMHFPNWILVHKVAELKRCVQLE